MMRLERGHRRLFSGQFGVVPRGRGSGQDPGKLAWVRAARPVEQLLGGLAVDPRGRLVLISCPSASSPPFASLPRGGLIRGPGRAVQLSR